METLAVNNLTFRYPETGVDVLKSISFSVKSGEFITLCGPSGCGKSTLLRHLKPALAPHGIKTGQILFEEKSLDSLSSREQSSKIGYVLQSPENQIVTDKVWHELAFGLESLGYDNSTIRKRVAETASFFGIQNWFDKNVNELSGGQKQILNLASIMAMQPSILILDEPTSQLDPIASSEFLSCISKINRDLGTTIIITEHRLEEVLPISNRVLVIENGKIISYDTPENTGKNLKKNNSKTFLSMPASIKIWEAVDNTDEKCPVTIAQGREWLENYVKSHSIKELYPENIPAHSQLESISLNDVWFRYEKNSPDILKGLSLKIFKGEFAAILGGNGTGKSTTLSLINGTNVPYRGNVSVLGADNSTLTPDNTIKVATLPQNPQTLFVKKTVYEDLQEILDNSKNNKEENATKIKEVISLCELNQLIGRHPYDLSGGEQQRAALAKILLLCPDVLLLDEPTKGLDAEFKITFAKIISSLIESGVTVLMVSHDVEFCAKYTHRCFMFFNGEIVSEETPRNFFASNSFYSTSANRISRNIICDAVTTDDVIYCITGKKPVNNEPKKIEFFEDKKYVSDTSISKKQKLFLWKKILGIFSALMLVAGIAININSAQFFNDTSNSLWLNLAVIAVPVILIMISFSSISKKSIDSYYNQKSKRKLQKRTVVSSVMILIAIPITIFIGFTYLQDEKFLFISLLVMIECMLPFFLVFERRKPQTRELVIIAVLCAITVASRVALYMIPQFKPIIALVIIAGVAFGGESGFLVGSLSMLVSNIMFQQGPWTPWQMFSMGIIGFLAGILFKKGLLSHSRIALCVFGFTVSIVIYGGIMNISSAVMAHAQLNFGTIMAFYATGLPMDIIQGIATALFLFFGAEPMLEKLDRVKTKYGLLN